MADHLDLADFGKTFDTAGAVQRAQRLCRVRKRNVERRQLERAFSRRAFLEDQAFALARVPRGFFDSFGHRE